MENETINWIPADWHAPSRVHAGTTTRRGGLSTSPYDSFNIALHVGDDHESVQRNREQLVNRLNLPSEPVWLKQVHGSAVTTGDNGTNTGADACITDKINVVCGVMTADCIPLLMCNDTGTKIAAIHVGWRGLCRGIVTNTVGQFDEHDVELMAWIGPHVCAQHYPVRDDMRTECIRSLGKTAESAFTDAGDGGWHADIEKLARIELERLGVVKIYTYKGCTYAEDETFYSYRRDHTTGRMASLIWIRGEG